MNTLHCIVLSSNVLVTFVFGWRGRGAPELVGSRAHGTERERERERKKSLIHHRRGGPSGRPKSPWGRELHVEINSSNVNPGMFD